ncbi:hypothetical protein HPB47_027231 [Ixodes persulcatus]|uniref:Uncharacterized protein n=1 Tax=Ixodes persulcatus TaxID=34615 RepID=A0AC60PWG9_IXOPE|nr:hypothetical protein HPB47_027231 [Ixodes persulcatus]
MAPPPCTCILDDPKDSYEERQGGRRSTRDYQESKPGQGHVGSEGPGAGPLEQTPGHQPLEKLPGEGLPGQLGGSGAEPLARTTPAAASAHPGALAGLGPTLGHPRGHRRGVTAPQQTALAPRRIWGHSRAPSAGSSKRETPDFPLARLFAP